MDRRDFLKSASVGLSALALPRWLAEATAADAPAAAKPNVIFILTDDVGMGDIGCCGGRFKTPAIDALAQAGTRFELCFSTPLCGPSRCQAMTGRYPFRTGLNSNHSADAISPVREVMTPTVLKKAGYVTAQAGKWGQMCLGPGEWGFDEYLVFRGSGRYWRDQTTFYRLNGRQKELPAGVYLPDLMHDFVVDFISRNKDKPFFLFYSMSHIHGPIVRTPDSKPGSDHYADNIAYMDKLVGKLATELDRLKLREKTLVLFTGDNGTAGGPQKAPVNGRPLSGAKGSMLEGGSRVPLLANWPGVTPAGKVNSDLVDFSDFLPTFAELAGAQVPEGKPVDGHSFAPQLKGEKGKPREWVYVELDGRSYARNARWKLTNGGQLFDMKEAPFREIPVAADTADPDAIAARKQLQEVLNRHPAAPAGEGPAPKRKQKGKAKANAP